MDLNVANRLIEYRKKAGFSQEELADKLGVSRQAVSKWERTEASPDTDNLIALAKLYNVSLDELVGHVSQKDCAEEDIKENKIEVTPNEIHIVDGEDEIHINQDGVVIESKDEDDEDNEEDIKEDKKPFVKAIVDSFAVIVVLVYLGFGLFYKGKFGVNNIDAWAALWPLFILIPVPDSIYHMIKSRRITKFNYPAVVTSAYCFLGMLMNWWHPMWALFVTIPLFYIIFSSFERQKKK